MHRVVCGRGDSEKGRLWCIEMHPTRLFKSLEIRDTTASTQYPVANPHAGKFRVEVSRYLSNTQYTGFSDKAWYLLAAPTDLPVIEVAFLNGQESPTRVGQEANSWATSVVQASIPRCRGRCATVLSPQ
jgi:hypothetical protein